MSCVFANISHKNYALLIILHKIIYQADGHKTNLSI